MQILSVSNIPTVKIFPSCKVIWEYFWQMVEHWHHPSKEQIAVLINKQSYIKLISNIWSRPLELENIVFINSWSLYTGGL